MPTTVYTLPESGSTGSTGSRGDANYCFADGHVEWLSEGALLNNRNVYWGTTYWFNE